MALEKLSNLTDFDINVGVTEDAVDYYNSPPSFVVNATDYMVKDMGRFNNEAYTFYTKFDDITTGGKLRIAVGCTSGGVGKAIDIEGTTGAHSVSLVNISTWTGLPDSVLDTKNMYDRFEFNTTTWYKIEIVIANAMIRVWVNNILVLDNSLFAIAGNYVGITGINSSADVRVSEFWHYTDQVFWGNVNLNGVPNTDGTVALYNQETYTILGYVYVNAVGDYMLFIEDDPNNLNIFFMTAQIRSLPSTQGKGIGNITL